MKYITYETEKRVNALKKIPATDRTEQQKLAIYIWDKIFCDCGYYGATLKELEHYLNHKVDNNMQVNVYYYTGIHGLEYETNGNIKYIGTHDLSYVNIKDFNLWIKQLTA